MSLSVAISPDKQDRGQGQQIGKPGEIYAQFIGERGEERIYPKHSHHYPHYNPLIATIPKIIATYFQDTAPNYLPLKYPSLRFALVIYHLFTYLVPQVLGGGVYLCVADR